MNNIAIPAEEWANRIAAHWRESVNAIFEVGRLLEQSKVELGLKDWQGMCERLLPFSERTAYRLIAISSDPKLLTHVSILPPHWGTLNELTKLTDEQFKDAVDDGVIHPEMERRDISGMVKQSKRAAKERKLGGVQLALPDGKFGIIVADPPWRFEPYSDKGMDRAADNHYPTQALDQIIESHPVRDLAADDCVLFLWATAPMMAHALDAMGCWDFQYKSHFIWFKNKFGTGYWNRNCHELLLIGTKGKPPAPDSSTLLQSVIEAPVGKHSAKPECFLEAIERWYPTLPKIELNRRGPARKGWSAWGNETDVVPSASAGPAPASPTSDAGAGPPSSGQ